MGIVGNHLNILRAFVNECFKDREPWQIVTITTSTVLTTVWLYECISEERNLFESAKKKCFRLMKKIPVIRTKIKNELKNIELDFRVDALKRIKGLDYVDKLPDKGMSNEEIMNLLEEYFKLGEYEWDKGRVSGAVYYYDEKLIDLLTQVYGKAFHLNPLHSDVFPGICKMEAEVVRMTANLFHGGPDACGTMTSGGTESILMAVKASRDYAIHERGISYPNIVVSTTAHPAFDKAAQYLKVKIIHVKIDPKTTAVDVTAMKRAITRNTCLLVGSVPNFPYGTMDDIEAIAALGVKYNIPVHVDACLGGFVIAFMEKAGYQIKPFDFRVKGVTSISADTHKYGNAPKGSSVIMYREKKFLHHQYTVTTDWTGGVYGSPTVNGSRAGGVIASCWATLLHFGIDGYVESAKRIIETTKYIETELRKINSIFIFGSPVSSVVAIGSNVFHIYRLCDALSQRGWNLNLLQYPPGIHICITSLHTKEGVADSFIKDVREEVTVIMKEPDLPIEGKMAMYGRSANIPDRSIVGDFTRLFLDSTYFIPKSTEKQ